MINIHLTSKFWFNNSIDVVFVWKIQNWSGNCCTDIHKEFPIERWVFLFLEFMVTVIYPVLLQVCIFMLVCFIILRVKEWYNFIKNSSCCIITFKRLTLRTIRSFIDSYTPWSFSRHLVFLVFNVHHLFRK